VKIRKSDDPIAVETRKRGGETGAVVMPRGDVKKVFRLVRGGVPRDSTPRNLRGDAVGEERG